MFLYKTKPRYCYVGTRETSAKPCNSIFLLLLNEKPYHLGNLTFLMFFKVCSHFNQRLLKFDGISSSQSKEIFHSCCEINFASSIDGVKSPNGSKTEDIKLSKPFFWKWKWFHDCFYFNCIVTWVPQYT